MKSVIRDIGLCLLFLLILLPGWLFSQQSLFNARDEGRLVYQRYKNSNRVNLGKPSGKKDRGAALQDRGELGNVVGNFGIISHYHLLFAQSMHWPSWADDRHQYCFGLELLVGVNGDVVTSIHDPSTVAENYDWEALDGSLGNLFSGDVTLADGTPVLASSDDPNTWPADDRGNRFWPGPFRFDPQSGRQVPGEFVSERDVYCEYDDSNNQNGPYGLKVLQSAYSFGRTYARNFLIYDLKIINTSDRQLDSVYVGYMSDFKVDFDTHDHLRFGQPGKPKDLVYLWDGDPNAGSWDITGYIGFLVLNTPGNMGITDFHYFDNIYEPSTNGQIWEIMSSDTSGRHITPSIYFHGQNRRLDDDALADDMDPDGLQRGTDFVFIVSSGPFSLAPGDTVPSSFAVVMGHNQDELFTNADRVREMAANYFLGYSPPRPPRVFGASRNGHAVITWDGATSENSTDLLTNQMDFEGYRIYRSEDFGKTWGKPITDEKGNLIGYVPIAQYDLDNGIKGKDRFSHYYLGDDTGLRHTFVDSNVIKGKEYWYSVTAYDRGDQTENGYASLESSRGVTPDEPNLVSVIPADQAQGIEIPNRGLYDSIPPLGGVCDSRLEVEILDEEKLTGDHYRVTFNDTTKVIWRSETISHRLAIDTSYTTTFTLVNTTTGDTLLKDYPIRPEEEADNVPVTEGFRLKLHERKGVRFMGWTLVHGDTCTFDWHRQTRGNELGPPWMDGWDDFRLTVDLDGPGIPVLIDDQFGDTWGPENIPLEKVEMITDPQHPVDVSGSTWLIDYAYHGYTLPEPGAWFQFFGPPGWDLVPGGKGYNPVVEKWPDELSFRHYFVTPAGDTLRITGVNIRTQNRPDEIPPSDGDQYTVLTYKTFRGAISFEFDSPVVAEKTTAVQLSRIRVVPNPFIVRAGWERSQFEGRLQFTHLPPNCDITIYTTAGEQVATLHHRGFTDYEFWNLQNSNGVNVAFGLYVFVVKAPGGQKYTGKFAIIR